MTWGWKEKDKERLPGRRTCMSKGLEAKNSIIYGNEK